MNRQENQSTIRLKGWHPTIWTTHNMTIEKLIYKKLLKFENKLLNWYIIFIHNCDITSNQVQKTSTEVQNNISFISNIFFCLITSEHRWFCENTQQCREKNSWYCHCHKLVGSAFYWSNIGSLCCNRWSPRSCQRKVKSIFSLLCFMNSFLSSRLQNVDKLI